MIRISVRLVSFIIFFISCNSHIWGENQEISLYQLPQNISEFSRIPLAVKGKIPHWLKGVFIRNGAGIVKGNRGYVRHWFDGLAKLEGFYIDNGQVTYSCQFLRSDPYKKYKKTGGFDFNGFAQKSLEQDFSLIDFLLGSKNQKINNANVNVAKINQKFVALTEIPLPVEFDKNLNTIGYFDYDDKLSKNFCFESAHVLKDPLTQETWNFLINIGFANTSYQIYRIPNNSSERKLLTTIPVTSISYMHSFSLVGKYFVLIDYPLRSKQPEDLATHFIDAFSWQKDQLSIVYVIDRQTGEYQVYETDPFFSFHHINGFEKGNRIYIDLVAYPNSHLIWEVNKYPIIKKSSSKLMRLEIDQQSSVTKLIPLSSDSIEFPRINDSLISQEYQYVYAVHFTGAGSGLIKFDHNKSNHLYWAEGDCYANEPVFIPSPNATTEDEGVVMSIINNLGTKKSFLLILNAKNFKELARMEAPHLIPFGFHGQFFH